MGIITATTGVLFKNALTTATGTISRNWALATLSGLTTIAITSPSYYSSMLQYHEQRGDKYSIGEPSAGEMPTSTCRTQEVFRRSANLRTPEEGANLSPIAPPAVAGKKIAQQYIDALLSRL